MLPALLTTLFFSISVVCANRSAKMLGGTEANFWRLACATVMLGIWAYVFGEGVGGVSFPLFLLSGIIGVGADVFLFQSLPRLGSRLSLLVIQCGSAVFAAAVEWLWLGTQLTGWQMAACVVILLGVGLALAPGKHLNITRQTLIVGVVFGLFAAFGNGFGAVLSRKAYEVAGAAHENIDAGTAGFQRLIGGLIVAGLTLLVVRRASVIAQFIEPNAPRLPSKEKWRKAWPWILANSFAGQTLGVSCYQWALKTTPTGLVLAIVSITPIVVIPFACWMEHEKIERRSILGGIVAVAGAIGLVYIRTHHM